MTIAFTMLFEVLGNTREQIQKEAEERVAVFMGETPYHLTVDARELNDWERPFDYIADCRAEALEVLRLRD